MQPDFWHERWRSGQIGFHQAAVDPNLRRYWPRLGVPVGGRVFVPLCGKSLDLLWLRDAGHRVAGVELSPIALEAFCLENGIAARRREIAPFELYEAENLDLFRGDFFALTPERLGPIAAVYDRAALIAWMPALRAPYVAHLAALTVPGCRTLLLTLEYLQPQMSGPPFSVASEEVVALYAPHYTIEELGREDILAQEERLRSRGLTALTQVCYQLVRKG